ncbi:lemA family protein [bacterium BMS3Abin05]|nr:lemA family protein [bacterium BMS3Abin05]GBE27281.1 lemA family protein [bacterium BMS3Bbin03]HDK36179.1 LemA family protein [Bacteroidota bacterium]HDL78313.1 LemA family protein [Bacteroidota bacterium]HDZ12041.1 LemA family protein [Bacteroidota bacterium]
MAKKSKTWLWIVGALILLAIITYSSLKSTYNSLVILDEQVRNAQSEIENQLQRRYDLIPNYVATVKGYAAHEKDVLIKITEARSRIGSAPTLKGKLAANDDLNSALARLMVVVENYPNLKANENFIRLQDELAGTENRIAVARRRYNKAVEFYNKRVRQFPTNVIANMFGFQEKPYFEAPKAARQAPKVNFKNQ